MRTNLPILLVPGGCANYGLLAGSPPRGPCHNRHMPGGEGGPDAGYTYRTAIEVEAGARVRCTHEEDGPNTQLTSAKPHIALACLTMFGNDAPFICHSMCREPPKHARNDGVRRPMPFINIDIKTMLERADVTHAFLDGRAATVTSSTASARGCKHVPNNGNILKPGDTILDFRQQGNSAAGSNIQEVPANQGESWAYRVHMYTKCE